MTRDVLVTICGIQLLTDLKEKQDNIELTVSGSYYLKNGKHYILYDELTEGDHEVIHNTLKLQHNMVELRKKGASEAHMVFEKNKKNITCYHTPYGDLLMGIDASKVELQEEEDLIEARVNYQLEMNEEKMADCRISIRIQSKEAGRFRL